VRTAKIRIKKLDPSKDKKEGKQSINKFLDGSESRLLNVL
jgi:hypothetical protein